MKIGKENEFDGRALELFRQICKIPRQTGDEEQISRFLVDFAADRGLKAERDSCNNVLIRRASTLPDYHGPTVIVQGHMDMVYEKTMDSSHVYGDGIDVVLQDGYLMASEQTSLGADNGAAVALALDLLERTDRKLPDLEILITTGEEVGLAGVKNLGLTDFRGTYLLNLDAEEEGVFFTSCAGGVRSEISLPVRFQSLSLSNDTSVERSRELVMKVTLTLEGISGGHSGLEIGYSKANAVKIMGRILYRLCGSAKLASVDSPGKANAIASHGTMVFYVPENNWQKLRGQLEELAGSLGREYSQTDSIHFSFHAEAVSEGAVTVFTEETQEQILQLITALPYGVISRLPEDVSMVQTSSNIGAVTLEEDRLVFLSSSRSSVGSRKEELKERLQLLARLFHGECRFYGEYPQWEYRKDSRLREICHRVYQRYSGKEPVFVGIHAGIECGYLAEKLGQELDMISFGANLSSVHTPREKMELKSFIHTEEILIQILEEIAGLETDTT